MKICCISDTHELHRQIRIPQCDLLVHAGDITMGGNPIRVVDFDNWCKELITRELVKVVVCIAGNHDFVFQDDPEVGRNCLKTAYYLQDSSILLEGFRIYGTPWQPWFYDWAFNIRGEEGLQEKFDQIPQGIEILICHSPPAGILSFNLYGQDCGSTALLQAIDRVKPRLVVFGHIHESYGLMRKDDIIFVNASICTLRYEVANAPILIEL